MTQKISSLICVLLLAACGGSSDPGTDAATPPNDTGAIDAAHEHDDGGSDVDAFVADEDADVEDVDAFVPPPDCEPHTFVVTATASAYQFDGGPNNETLVLCAGVTYGFDMSAVSTSHPIRILAGTESLIEFEGGTTDNEYTVPSGGTQPDSYDCRLHRFGGDITIHTP